MKTVNVTFTDVNGKVVYDAYSEFKTPHLTRFHFNKAYMEAKAQAEKDGIELAGTKVTSVPFYMPC